MSSFPCLQAVGLVPAVCSVCQQKHKAHLDQEHVADDPLQAAARNMVDWFVMASHLVAGAGVWCSGAGTTPEVLIRQ